MKHKPNLVKTTTYFFISSNSDYCPVEDKHNCVEIFLVSVGKKF